MHARNQGSASPDHAPETGSRRTRHDEEFGELLPDTLNRRLGLEGVARRRKGDEPAPTDKDRRW